jgi:hypothetical protein
MRAMHARRVRACPLPLSSGAAAAHTSSFAAMHRTASVLHSPAPHGHRLPSALFPSIKLGEPSASLPLLHYVLLGYSHHVAGVVAKAGYEVGAPAAVNSTRMVNGTAGACLLGRAGPQGHHDTQGHAHEVSTHTCKRTHRSCTARLTYASWRPRSGSCETASPCAWSSHRHSSWSGCVAVGGQLGGVPRGWHGWACTHWVGGWAHTHKHVHTHTHPHTKLHARTQGFAERKVLLVCDVIGAAKKIHADELRKERLAALKSRSVRPRAEFGPGFMRAHVARALSGSSSARARAAAPEQQSQSSCAELMWCTPSS